MKFLYEVDEILSRRQILITCGTGGVGKTTLSSAMAIRAAMMGRKVAVITIDPAKRLKTALGMTELGDQPTDLTPRLREMHARLRAEGADVPERFTGSLVAIVPDTKRTFERFIDEIAPSPASSDRLKRNPIFEMFAREFSGSNEYMALLKLHELHSSGRYDCIVLDTPPSRNTLALLRAPRILAQFFEERLIRWLVTPANRLVSAGMRKALGLLEKLTGEGFMTHLLAFATSLFEMQGKFTANLKSVTELMVSEKTGFVMVTAPNPEVAREASLFVASAREHHLHFDGVIVNRTLGYLAKATASAEVKPAEARKLLEGLIERESRVFLEMERAGVPIRARLPELARDVHSVEDLFHVAMAFGADRDLSLRAESGI